MEKFEYKEQYKYLSNAMLNVTDDCNLACRYCFVEQHPHYMTLDTAKKAADWLYNNLQEKIKLNIIKDKKCNLNFFGGEPLLCYDSVIVPLVQYCKEKYPNIFNFGMTTNGTLLTEDKLKFFQKHNFSILLSIDGGPETQNFNRPCRNCQINSSNLLEKNIPNILKYFPNTTFRSTGYAPTIHHLFENYLYAEKLGFKNYILIPDVRHSWTDEEKKSFQIELSKIYNYRIAQLLESKKSPMVYDARIQDFVFYIDKLLNNQLNKEKKYDLLRCGLGTTNGSIGYDGNIYGCQEQTSKDEKNIFLIGNIFNGGIDFEKHYNFLKRYYDDRNTDSLFFPKCEKCYLKEFCNYCTISCPSTSWDLNKNFYSMEDITCFYNQIMFKNTIMLMNIVDTYKQQEEEINNKKT